MQGSNLQVQVVALSEPVHAHDQSPGALLRHIREAQKEADLEAEGKRDARRRQVQWLVWLGPLAVGLLAVHASFSLEGFWALGVGFIEVIVLLAMLFLTLLRSAGVCHEQWVLARLRAELLRREEFLFRARVGPYLKRADREWVYARVMRLCTDNHLMDLIALCDERRVLWQNELSDLTIENPNAVLIVEEDLPRKYLQERLEEQIAYFTDRRARNLEGEERCEWLLKGLLIGAVVLAVIRLVKPTVSEGWHHLLVALGLIFPALCSGVIAWRAAFEYQRNLRASEQKLRRLRQLESEVRALESVTKTPTGAVVFQLKRKILEAEELLSQDLYEWWLIIAPAEPKAEG